VLELWQAEWCPHSHGVRQRLTELGVDFVTRQVPADAQARDELREATGTDEIPVLVPPGEPPVAGEDAIRAYLDERFAERPDAGRHRAKARVEVPEFAELRR
jgi:glutathione S-transferase